MKMIKNVILDYNGVISNDFTLMYNGVQHIFKQLQLPPISYKQLREDYEIPVINFYQKYIPNPDIDKLNQYYFEAYDKKAKPEPYPGVADTLEKLSRQGVHLVILSSHDKARILDELKDFGIDQRIFDAVYGNVKDKRQIISEVLATHKMRASETAYVGDTEHDIETAIQVGVKSIASTYGYKPKPKLELMHPDYYLDSFSALPALLR